MLVENIDSLGGVCVDKTKSRIYRLDGDSVEITLVFDNDIGQYISDYPDFELYPRITPGGKRWVNSTAEGCPFADKTYGDCGSCPFFLCERDGDLIGICNNKNLVEQRKEA